ncbi:MAG: magnesium transporter [Coriobacteriia bacterium]|nr:magnesium transporter [Coriobacteriia bacterium]
MNERILQLLSGDAKDLAQLRGEIVTEKSIDIALLFEKTNKEESLRLFRLLPKNMSADIFALISADIQQSIVEGLTDNEISLITNELFVDDLVDFIEELPPIVVTRVLNSVDVDKRLIVNEILRYPKDSAGSVMTTEFIQLPDNHTVRQAMYDIRETGMDKETIYTCYVVDPDSRLIGQVNADTLIHADPHQLIIEVMDGNVLSVSTSDDREVVVGLFSRYGLIAVPVVDNEGLLVGIVTIDDVMHIIDEETTEDFEKMAALNPSDDPYFKTGVFKQARNRIGWLMLLMLSDTINGSVIASYENSLAVLPILVAFIPMLMGAGGNASAQASTVIIRGLALDEITFKDLAKVIWKEVRVGLACGFTLGLANFIRIFLMNGRDAVLSLVVTSSLLLGIVFAKTLGCLLPIGAKKLRLDPAVMAAPILTTIVDFATLIIYFLVAKLVYHI